MFLTPWKQTGWVEQVIESMLYTLWDLGLKVGHSSRSLDDMVRMATSDLTVRTALLEGRFIWGDQALNDEGIARFHREVVAGTERHSSRQSSKSATSGTGGWATAATSSSRM